MEDPVKSLNHLTSMYVDIWKGQAVIGAIDLELFTKLSGKQLNA
jgi:hypothetical protein